MRLRGNSGAVGLAGCGEGLEYVFGATEGFLHVGTDVLQADDFFKFCLVDELPGLLAGAAKDEGAFGSVQVLCQIFQREEAGGINGGHVP